MACENSGFTLLSTRALTKTFIKLLLLKCSAEIGGSILKLLYGKGNQHGGYGNGLVLLLFWSVAVTKINEKSLALNTLLKRMNS